MAGTGKVSGSPRQLGVEVRRLEEGHLQALTGSTGGRVVLCCVVLCRVVSCRVVSCRVVAHRQARWYHAGLGRKGSRGSGF